MKTNSLALILSALCLTLSLVPDLHAAADNTPPASPVKLIFVHHSTGGNWLADANQDQPYGGLGTALKNNNYYVSATNYGWGPNSIGDSTDIPNWPDWFTGANSSTILSALYAESDQNVGDFGSWSRLATDPGGENEIIMFKSCFPNSDLFGNPNDTAGSTPNDQYTVSNAKAVYNNLLTYFQTRTDKLFIVITAPPQNENAYAADYQTAAERAANARAFNNWLVNDWLASYPYSNVAVFDYYNVLTASDNHHRFSNNTVEHVVNTSYNFAAYPTGEWDSHPSSTGHQKATSEFVDLLNYYYNTWQAAAGSSSSSDSVRIKRLSVSPTDKPRAGETITVTVDAESGDGSPVYFKFYYRGNYGSDAYNTSPWTVVQRYSTTNSADYTFEEEGSYIIVVRAVTDPNNEPDALPIIGHAVNVGPFDEVNITALTDDLYTSADANDPVQFSVTASTPADDVMYYRFYYRANYGTSAYDTTPWTVVQAYSTSNSCQYSFPARGEYIVVARAVTDTANEPAALPIIGQTVSVVSAIDVTSTAFSSGGSIPQTYTCDDQDISPHLSFANLPAETQSLVVICDDPDAPSGTFVHWVLYNLPADTTSLTEGSGSSATLASGAMHGANDFGSTVYGGPCPPSGTHRYYFKVYALDTTLSLAAGASKSQVEAAMAGHILSSGQLMGTYGN